MINPRHCLFAIGVALLGCCFESAAGAEDDGALTCRLYDGLTAYVNNPAGAAFSVQLEIRDINLLAQGPREVLFKVYDPDGRPVVREIIPDDGVTRGAYPGLVGGWGNELSYYASLYTKGTIPAFRWSMWSDPYRLKALKPQTVVRNIDRGGKGVYRIVLAGASDHYVTLKLTPALKFGLAGHPTWIHGHGDLLKRRYIYVPKDSVGVFFAVVEPDQPPTRTFTLTGPAGEMLFECQATGAYRRAGGRAHADTTIKFADPAAYGGRLLTLDVSEGTGDYLLRIALQQPKAGVFGDYVGMSSLAVYCADPATAMALQGGTFVEDGLVFWHPFQARFHRWLKANPLDANEAQKALRKELEILFNDFRLLETSDGCGSATWVNWSYGFGYYGCRIWRRSWRLMARPDVPDDVKAIIREGLIMGGDRLSFAANAESVNGNAFAQVPVALWYSQRATGDALQQARFEVFWDRWKNQGWGLGLGLSKSGDAQEFCAHDMHYGSYIMDNWKATNNTWVREGGILGDATDDPRFQEVMQRYYALYSYLYCREQDKRPVPANPWSARTHMHPHHQEANWEFGPNIWKGEPGPDLTASVNGGDEWFAARRKGYYIVTFHGRLAPEWMCRSFPGQLGFGGGIICQLTVPGRGPVLASTLTESYGTGMHPSNWRNMHIHSVVGETWDGRPLIAAISEHANARLAGNTVTGSGEVRDAHVKALRRYTYQPDGVDCAVQLQTSDFVESLSIFSWERYWSEVKFAYEMIPFLPKDPSGKNPTTVTLLDNANAPIGPATTTPTEARVVRIDRGGFGVEIRLANPLKVLLGANDTVMIQIAAESAKPTKAEDIALQYRLVPFGN